MHLGNFNAEACWRDPQLARLPAIPDPSTVPIIAAMEELLFPCCQPGDLLLTHFPMHAGHAAYLEQLGFHFDYNGQSLQPGDPGEQRYSIFELLTQSPTIEAQELLARAKRISPYAVLPGMAEFCERNSLLFDGPSLAAVIQANSKVYSHQVGVELGLRWFGRLVCSAGELIEQGRQFLADGMFLIKDPFGVSGNGNLLIQTTGVLERIAAYLALQEKQGKQVSLVLEPFFNKKLDFSCQLEITSSGQVLFRCLQKMHNRQFNYQGSSRLDTKETTAIERSGYFRQVEALAKRIFQDGYWGDLCVDSMWLADGQIVPLIEINARKSMGLINHALETFFRPETLSSYLGYISIGFSSLPDFDELLSRLDSAGLLFTQKRRQGLIPLSANTLLVNTNPSGPVQTDTRLRKGRFYFSILSNAAQWEVFLEKIKCFFQGLGATVFN